MVGKVILTWLITKDHSYFFHLRDSRISYEGMDGSYEFMMCLAIVPSGPHLCVPICRQFFRFTLLVYKFYRYGGPVFYRADVAVLVKI